MQLLFFGAQPVAEANFMNRRTLSIYSGVFFMRYAFIGLVLGIVLLSVAFVAAEDACTPDLSKFSAVNNFSIGTFAGAKALIGDHQTIALDIGEQTFYYNVTDGFVNSVPGPENPQFIVTTDLCTLDRIQKGGDAIAEYHAKHITVRATTTGSSIKLWFARFGLTIYGWFR